LQLFDFIEANFGFFIVFEFFLMTCVSAVNSLSQSSRKSPFLTDLVLGKDAWRLRCHDFPILDLVVFAQLRKYDTTSG